MKAFLSPKELAAALGVSESSVKRWADEGRIVVGRTVGGHRRIGRKEAIRFVRRNAVGVARPDLLGFPEVAEVPAEETGVESAEEALMDALMEGHTSRALGLVHGAYLAGRPLAWIFDSPMAKAMHRIGELWEHRPDGIFLEHRATQICIQAIMRLRLSLPEHPETKWSAVGAACKDDPFLLPTMMAATIVHEAGINAVDLGPETPLSALEIATQRLDTRLVWLSVSVESAARKIIDELPALAERLANRNIALIVGGRGSDVLAKVGQPNLTFGAKMADLQSFASRLVTH